MLHTAHFYLDLTREELHILENHLGVSYEDIGSKADEYADGFKTWVTKKYGTRLHFIIDFIKLLGKPNIRESDYLEADEKLKGFIFYLFLDQEYYNRVVLIRIDYRLDVRIPENHRKAILYLYKKTAVKHRHQKRYDQYGTTIYFNSKSIQGTCYDKEVHVHIMGREIEDYEKGILRFEVRLENRHLKYMKYRQGKEKWLEEYFKQELYVKYMKQYLGTLVHSGDYFKISSARKIINGSSLKVKEQEKLLEFLRYVSRYGIEKAKEKYTGYYFNKFLNQLKHLNINPILIPRDRKDFPSFMRNPFTI
ncbi:phage/plasmid replication domain-containing protein [Niallia sp. 03133]|uniref:phage/plasmid replication domain-containing protein n=1 Tax=Niallia sp. 03133 TaxID=3458060 RepID=UPI0040446B47